MLYYYYYSSVDEMWLLLACFLIVPSSAIPFGNPPPHYHGLLGLGEWPILNSFQRPSFCVPSPFFGRLCLPSISGLLSPMRTLQVKKQGCVTIPLVPEYVVKLCPSNETKEQGDNIKEPQKEIIMEEEQEGEKKEKEEEPEGFSDNAVVLVNGEVDEAEKFVEKDKSESRFERDDNDDDDDDDVRNKIIQLSEEIIRFDNENNFPQPTSMIPDEDEENVSITSNLV